MAQFVQQQLRGRLFRAAPGGTRRDSPQSQRRDGATDLELLIVRLAGDGID
jgi:hypothetical protein